ncbi:family 16 glycoside hydrolase [Catellatospora sp. TT07R-123]|uniref:family 16 glycoside hydrolase n=1 Tax=Catellatospora sp. TT07R-123 TaxID=2733863 RepID=UPI001BB4500A|nr:family 16 glycoside hydrolase [Catellatospora sp. TT07R-123]
MNDALTSDSGIWSNGDPNSGTCVFDGKGLHAKATNYYHQCHSSTSASDFTYEVEFEFGTARVAGLLFRCNGGGTGYYVEVGRSGHIWLNYGIDGKNHGPEDLLDVNVPEPDVKAAHKLAVTAVGDVLTVYFDGKKLKSVTDKTLTSGTVSVLTDGGAAPSGASGVGETVFRNARLWTPAT